MSPNNSQSVSSSGLIRLLLSVLGPDLKAERKAMLASLFLALFGTLLGLGAPYFIHHIIDNATGSANPEVFARNLLYMAISLVLFFIFWGIQIYVTVGASQRMFLSLKNRLMATILRKPIDFFRQFNEGELMTRMANDLDFLSNFFHENVVMMLVNLMLALVISVFLLSWHPILGVLSLLGIPIYFVAIALILNPVDRRAALARAALTVQNRRILDILRGVREILFFQQDRQARQLFGRAASDYATASRRSVFVRDWSMNLIEGLGVLVCFSPVIVGAWMMSGEGSAITAGVLIAYYTYLMLLTDTLMKAAQSMTRLAEVGPVLARVAQILEAPERSEVPMTSVLDVPDRLSLEFREVGFYFQPDRPILQDFNLHIAEGEKVAIMGGSGSGKSTLLDLILRFKRPSSGAIYLGDQDIAGIPLSNYLSVFSLVGQSSHFMAMSVADNIRFGWYHVPLDRAIEAAKLVQLHDVIMQLPDGYDTILDGDDINLSGGQRQRLALARAVIRDPGILILDEFTSALDAPTEKAILADLLSVFSRQTIICVTHSRYVASQFERTVWLGKDQAV